MDSQVAAVQAALWQQGMFSEPAMDLRDQCHYHCDAIQVRIACIERPVAQVVIDVPHALATSLPGDTQ